MINLNYLNCLNYYLVLLVNYYYLAINSKIEKCIIFFIKNSVANFGFKIKFNLEFNYFDESGNVKLATEIYSSFFTLGA